MIWTPPPRALPNPVVIHPWSRASLGLGVANISAAASGTGPTTMNLYPLYLMEPFTVAKAFWCNGATVGTDSIDLGVYAMTDMATGRCDLIRSTGAVLSAGTASVVQEVSAWKVGRANLTSGNDSTDRSSAPGYTTASVTLKAGRLYLLSFVNTAADAAVASAITGGPGWTSRSSTQFNTTGHRVSIWSGVPTVDYTGTIDIAFGATQTGCCWVLDEMSGVGTSTTDGIVQQAVGTGNSTTPLATLAAFGSANNATYGATGVANTSTVAPGAGFTELAEATAATPASRVETEWSVANDTTVDSTVTSGQWGMCAVEIKADTSPFVIPPSAPGVPNIYMAFVCSGSTATILRKLPGAGQNAMAGGLQGPSGSVLASTITPGTAVASSLTLPLAGFSLRSLIG